MPLTLLSGITLFSGFFRGTARRQYRSRARRQSSCRLALDRRRRGLALDVRSVDVPRGASTGGADRHTGKYDDSASYDVFAADLAAANGDFGRFNPEQQAQIMADYFNVA